MKPGKTGLGRIFDAFGYSMKGFAATWRHEAAFRQEAVLMVLLAPLAFWLGETAEQKALLLLTLFIVIIAELTNSAIEATIDRIGHERHELSGRAKDTGSALVLTSIVMALVVWGVILIPRWLG